MTREKLTDEAHKFWIRYKSQFAMSSIKADTVEGTIVDVMRDFALEAIANREREIAIRLRNECESFATKPDCPFCRIAGELDPK